MNTLTAFTYGSTVVRTAGSPEQPMFCVQDICTVLGIKNHKNKNAILEQHEKDVVQCLDRIGRKQNKVFCTEPGFYRIVFSVQKNLKTEPFKKWVFHEVLPAIRKTGKYENEELMRQVAILKDTTKTQQNLIQALSKENRRYNIRQVLETDRACQNAVSPLVANNIAKKFARDNAWENTDMYTNTQRMQLISELRKRIVHDCSTGRVVLAR